MCIDGCGFVMDVASLLTLSLCVIYARVTYRSTQLLAALLQRLQPEKSLKETATSHVRTAAAHMESVVAVLIWAS